MSIAVVIGVGGIGDACAEALAADHTLLVADFDASRAAEVSARYGGTAHQVDVSDAHSVRALAEAAAAAGPITKVVHTAGVSPTQAPVAAILAVDLVGTVHVLDAFGEVIADGGSGVMIASVAGHIFAPHLSSDHAKALATTPADELLDLPLFDGLDDRGTAYGFAKRGNHLRVQAAARTWGIRGARVNSVSPGVVDTPMGQSELSGPDADLVRMLIDLSPVRRAADPREIAAAAMYLLSDAASFVTGTDLLVDGGSLSALTA